MVWDLPMNGFSSWKKNIWPKSSSLTAEQIKFIEKVNPCFEERHIESSRPRRTAQSGYALCRSDQRNRQGLHAIRG